MELKDFTGAHMLSGIDRVEKEDMHGIAFIIDGKKYAVYEDPDDGWRSYLTELEEYKGKILNVFPYQQVVGIFKDNILTFIKPSDSSLILELGTGESDGWYPYAVMEFHPENMDVNIT